MRWKTVTKLWLVVVLAVIVGGCGGGGGGLGDDRLSVNGELTTDDFDENRYFDVYEFIAETPGEATIEMQSDEIDSYLIVYREQSLNDYLEIAKDDDSGSGRDAKVTFQIEAATRYRIVATAYSRQTGSYRFLFSRNLGQASQLLPARDAASVNDMALPRVEQRQKPVE